MMMKLISLAIALASLKRLYGYLFLGEDHPLNMLLNYFGYGPKFQAFNDLSWFDVPSLSLFIGFSSAAAVYLIPAGLLILAVASFDVRTETKNQGTRNGHH